MGLHIPVVPTLACSDVDACLEGVYSDWTLYDSHNDADCGTTEYSSYGCFNTEETKALFVASGICAKLYDVAAKTLGASLLTPDFYGEGDFGQPYFSSVLGRYKVCLAAALDRIHVLKDGAIIKTITNVDLGEAGVDIVSVSISPSGKYLLIVLDARWVGPVNVGCWFIFEGS